MANKMLIDATHPEETRVTVVRGNRVEEFDFEAANRKQLRGNIYLAKVTRVEPSLQAAFVEYGGNRHGFLAFSEIHPDYYQLPEEDRRALEAQLQAEAEANQRERERREKEEARREAEREAAAAAREAENNGENAPEDEEDTEEQLARLDAPHQEDSIEDIEPELPSLSDDEDSDDASQASAPLAANTPETAPQPTPNVEQQIASASSAPETTVSSQEEQASATESTQNAVPSQDLSQPDTANEADEVEAGDTDKKPGTQAMSANNDHVISGEMPEEGSNNKPENAPKDQASATEPAQTADTPAAASESQSEPASGPDETQPSAPVIKDDAVAVEEISTTTSLQPTASFVEPQPAKLVFVDVSPEELAAQTTPSQESSEEADKEKAEAAEGEEEQRPSRQNRNRRSLRRTRRRRRNPLNEIPEEKQADDKQPVVTEEKSAEESVDQVGNEDALEEVPERPRRLRDSYKIQEVIKRRQLLLVQVVKEERGNKGAALTTYLSLAGRYSVLMPNTDRGGGISRKITKPVDRKRLKQVASDLDVPRGMGVILRTAGASRTKAEIKRDFEYLLRLWESVRELTLNSAAPRLVYEEGSLIKRSIRDLYNKDIDQVLVSGEEGYREAKDFMRMLMPSHAKNVQPYRDATPLFTRFGVEAQLDAMFSPQVTLKSGGYIVINQTEALVAIDVNSGKSTREQNIEDTALATNLEAAEEISRQLRLRDLAGLVVIDFIDMEENRNNRAVERRLKECLKTDRARIQVGRISHFGLLEMSRQRLRTGVLESSSVICPHCRGAGIVRSVESVALHILRSMEEQLLRGVTHDLIVHTPAEVALYILNQKRHSLSDLENRFGLSISVNADDSVSEQHFTLERGAPVSFTKRYEQAPVYVQPDSIAPVTATQDEIEEIEPEETEDVKAKDEESNDKDRRRRRRRRRRRDERDSKDNETQQSEEAEDKEEGAKESQDQPEDNEGKLEPVEQTTSEEALAEAEELSDEEERRRKRRRGRRGGRRSRRRPNDELETSESEANPESATFPEGATDTPSQAGEPADETQAAQTGTAAEEKAPESTPTAAQSEPKPVAVEAPAEPAQETAPAELADKASDTGDDSAAQTAQAPKSEPTPVVAAKVEAQVEAAPQSNDFAEEKPQENGEVEEKAKPKYRPAPKKPVVTSQKIVEGEAVEVEEEEGQSRRTGWWQRRSFF
ncbi:ribonuclease E/G [Polycladidibacter stylochi]|uniref:ribonuclease E/G n=1 Tax=Polycladidibacter stylochi TaxID=1807766 RepID=UPI000831ED60|nr:ribonuclease E/G [Pseudovibrio stylochi]